MNHGSLFSGIGGFDLASEWMGWNNVFHCEWMPFPKKILKYYWPNAISYEDITKTDFTIHRGGIDIITGGFPCQPYSTAGKRLGKEDERHLWPEMLRAIKEIQPTWVVGENVYGLTNWNGGLVFEEVCVDLENCGYETQPIIIPACSVNAPHKRDRVWFIAKNTNFSRFIHRKSYEKGNKIWKQRNIGSRSSNWIHTQTNEFNSSDSNSKMLEYRDGERKTIKRTEPKERIKSFDRTRNWETFPTQPTICGGNDGLPTELDGIAFSKWKKESIKGYGNAVVPQLVFEIFKVIEQMNSNN